MMNKEKLEAKLHNYEERLKDIAKAIEELRDQVAKVEKPKLRFSKWTKGCGLLEISECRWAESEIGIEFRVEDKTATATLSEAEEIRNGLSDMIAELKRKENKCS